MEAIRALIYAVAVFVALGIIALIVAGVMKLLYTMVHKSETRTKNNTVIENKSIT
jgi:hypothetical protein